MISWYKRTFWYSASWHGMSLSCRSHALKPIWTVQIRGWLNALASQITSPMIVHSIVYSDADQRKHQSSVSLAFVRGIHRGPLNSPPKWPVTRKMFPFDDVIMTIFVNAARSHSHIHRHSDTVADKYSMRALEVHWYFVINQSFCVVIFWIY